MTCPKCKSSNVTVQAVNEVKEKHKKGLVYWVLCFGWLWEMFAWLFLTLPKLFFAIFGKHKKIVSKTVSYAVCQDCGHKWKV